MSVSQMQSLKRANEDEEGQASRIWPHLIANEVAQIESQGDRYNLLAFSHQQRDAGPKSYYSRLLQYLESKSGCSESLQMLTHFIDDLTNGTIETKSQSKAAQLRAEGNIFFKAKQYAAAANVYREGLMYAPDAFPSINGSDANQCSGEAALLHGNLSACFAHLHQWSACAWQSALAVKLSPSESPKVGKLTRRLSQAASHLHASFVSPDDCLNKLADFSASIRHDLGNMTFNCHEGCKPSCNVERYGDVLIPTPKYGRQKSMHAFANGLSIDSLPVQGRFLIATTKFLAGDVIASEPAGGWPSAQSAVPIEEQAIAASILLPFQRHVRCSACHNKLTSLGFVCPECTDAAFCGPPSSCFTKHVRGERGSDYAILGWHKDECRFMFLLNSVGLGHLCFRLASLRLRGILPDGTDASYPSLDDLVDNFAHYPSPFDYALTGWLLGTIMKRLSPDTSSIGFWCFQMLLRLQCNAHALTEIANCRVDLEDLEVAGFRQDRIGVSMFPAVSMINHACEPNVTYQFLNGFLVIRCLRDLSAGDEVVACYGPHYLHHPSPTARRQALKEQYFFTCHCQHCLEGEPSRLAPLQIVEWRRLVETLRNTTSKVTLLKTVRTLRFMSIGIGQLPDGDTLGGLLDETARRLLTLNKTPENQLLSATLVTESVAWVRNRFGEMSTEYAWELVKLASQSDSESGALVGASDLELPPTKSAAYARIVAILAVHYGDDIAKQIIEEL